MPHPALRTSKCCCEAGDIELKEPAGPLYSIQHHIREYPCPAMALRASQFGLDIIASFTWEQSKIGYDNHLGGGSSSEPPD